jgi:uncharacterized membrane protein
MSIVIVLIWLIVVFWTVRRLIVQGRGDNVVYTLGVRGFGIALWASVIVAGGLMCKQNTAQYPLWYCITAPGFFSLPFCLWAGYLWGKIMRMLFPNPPSE